MAPPPPAAGVFAANPLSLSVPDPAFETWLRDTGYLEVLDEHASSSAVAVNQPRCRRPESSSSVPSASNTEVPSSPSLRRRGRVSAFVGVVRTVLAVLTINPFAKLTAEDFSGSTPPWTAGFLTSESGGQGSSYSWPAGPSQARMRVHENVKRYARNYVCLCLLFFTCSLYKMPLALFGLVSSLAMWEALKFASRRWHLEERHPGLKFVLVRIAQLATVVILYYSKFQIAFLCAISVSYTVMILHASLRKLTSSRQSAGINRSKRSHHGK